jgi:hypothetical protein
VLPPCRAVRRRGTLAFGCTSDYQPYVSLARPYVRFNGRIVGISEPGGAFYRDVVPGGYDITVDSQGHDVNQFAHATVVADQQICRGRCLAALELCRRG